MAIHAQGFFLTNLNSFLECFVARLKENGQAKFVPAKFPLKLTRSYGDVENLKNLKKGRDSLFENKLEFPSPEEGLCQNSPSRTKEDLIYL